MLCSLGLAIKAIVFKRIGHEFLAENLKEIEKERKHIALSS